DPRCMPLSIVPSISLRLPSSNPVITLSNLLIKSFSSLYIFIILLIYLYMYYTITFNICQDNYFISKNGYTFFLVILVFLWHLSHSQYRLTYSLPLVLFSSANTL